MFFARCRNLWKHVSAVCVMGASVIIFTGEIIPGVECPALRTDEGRVIALSALPSTYAIGDRITVTGSGFAGSASCQQEVLVVTDVKPAS